MACDKVAGLLLAAGAGKRFGGGKLLADFNGSPLILSAAHALAAVTKSRSFAVSSPEVSAVLDGRLFTVIPNSSPELGIAHSIRLGVEAISKTDANSILLCLADMPYITPEHLVELIHRAKNEHSIVASGLGDVRSPPAIFQRSIWPDLLVLEGDKGAHKMLKTAHILLTHARILSDIDTPEDINRLSGMH
jgi:molybdenum cofactor cytidylyltransferase